MSVVPKEGIKMVPSPLLCPACSPERMHPYPSQRYGRSYTEKILHRSPSQYETKDFWVYPGQETGLGREGLSFLSKDGVIEANFFYHPGDAQVRGMIFDTKTGDITHTFRIGFPFGHVSDPPDPKVVSSVLRSVVRHLHNKAYVKSF